MPPAPVGVGRVLRFDLNQKKYIILVIGSLWRAFSFAQAPIVTTQGAYWVRYYNQTQFSKTFVLHFEVDERRILNPDRQAQFFTHVHLHKKISPGIEFAVGLNYNTTNSLKNQSLAVPELRPWQEINWTKVYEKLQLQIRYRVDERFIRHNDRIVLLDGYAFSLRHRFRTQLILPLNKALAARFAHEIMINTWANLRAFDQNRITISIEKQLNLNFSLEIGYLNLLQSQSDGYFDRHIIRTTLHHRVTLPSVKRINQQ
jgi:Protein of unknown function (DUF2490)